VAGRRAQPCGPGGLVEQLNVAFFEFIEQIAGAGVLASLSEDRNNTANDRLSNDSRIASADSPSTRGSSGAFGHWSHAKNVADISKTVGPTAEARQDADLEVVRVCVGVRRGS
jgi:hypothetical protein